MCWWNLCSWGSHHPTSNWPLTGLQISSHSPHTHSRLHTRQLQCPHWRSYGALSKDLTLLLSHLLRGHSLGWVHHQRTHLPLYKYCKDSYGSHARASSQHCDWEALWFLASPLSMSTSTNVPGPSPPTLECSPLRIITHLSDSPPRSPSITSDWQQKPKPQWMTTIISLPVSVLL